MARNESRGPYVVRDGITINMDEKVHAAEVGARRSSKSSFVLELVKIFRVSTTKYFRHTCAC